MAARNRIPNGDLSNQGLFTHTTVSGRQLWYWLSQSTTSEPVFYNSIELPISVVKRLLMHLSQKEVGMADAPNNPIYLSLLSVKCETSQKILCINPYWYLGVTGTGSQAHQSSKRG